VRKVKEPHQGAIIAGDVHKVAIASVGSDGYLHIYDPKSFELQAKH